MEPGFEVSDSNYSITALFRLFWIRQKSRNFSNYLFLENSTIEEGEKAVMDKYTNIKTGHTRFILFRNTHQVSFYFISSTNIRKKNPNKQSKDLKLIPIRKNWQLNIRKRILSKEIVFNVKNFLPRQMTYIFKNYLDGEIRTKTKVS